MCCVSCVCHVCVMCVCVSLVLYSMQVHRLHVEYVLIVVKSIAMLVYMTVS